MDLVLVINYLDDHIDVVIMSHDHILLNDHIDVVIMSHDHIDVVIMPHDYIDVVIMSHDHIVMSPDLYVLLESNVTDVAVW